MDILASLPKPLFQLLYAFYQFHKGRFLPIDYRIVHILIVLFNGLFGQTHNVLALSQYSIMGILFR